MTSLLLLGVGLGAGLLIILSGMFPTRLPLAMAIATVHRPRRSETTATVNGTKWTRLVGHTLASGAVGAKLERRFGTDLRVVGTSTSELVAKMMLASLVGLIWAPMVAGLMAFGGVYLPWVIPAWGSLLMAIAGAGVPLLGLRADASKRRRGFLHSLSCYLDLVAIRLAGGAGVDGALSHCAEASQSWAFAEIRRALAEARLMGEPPWAALGRLGEALDIPELIELAGSTALAGNEGARVRTSLTAKARSIRTKSLANAEANAQAASERMSLPVVLLMLGFVAFLGYPAVLQVLTGL